MIFSVIVYAALSNADIARALLAARPHDEEEKYFDVYMFVNDSKALTHFRATDSPCARISSSDIIAVVPESAGVDTTVARYEFELPQSQLAHFTKHCDEHRKQDIVNGKIVRSSRLAWLNRLARLR